MKTIRVVEPQSRIHKRSRFMCSLGISLILLSIGNSMAAFGFTDTSRETVIACILNDKLGHEIDRRERDVFHLFPGINGFLRARSYLKPDSTVLIRIERRYHGTVSDTTYTLTRDMTDEFRIFVENFDAIARGDIQPRFYLLIKCVDVRAVARLARESRVGRLDSYTSVPDRTGWVSLGIGRSSAGDLMSIGYVTALSPRAFFSLHFVHAEHSEIFKTPGRRIWDLGALIGIGTIDEKYRILASAGMGLIGGVQRGKCIESGFLWSKYESIRYSALGIPFEFQFLLKLSESGGIGFNLHANINSKSSFCGGALTLVGIG